MSDEDRVPTFDDAVALYAKGREVMALAARCGRDEALVRYAEAQALFAQARTVIELANADPRKVRWHMLSRGGR